MSLLADTVISFLAGFAVFPIVFAYGLDPASGPGLVFVTLPLAFAHMPFGTLAAWAFFVLLFVAALASAISLLELVVALLIRRAGMRRPVATLLAAGACYLAGLATVFSFNVWAQWRPLAGVAALADASFFDLLDGLTSNLMLPIGGMLISIFAGWIMPRDSLAAELGVSARAGAALAFLLRFVVPAGIGAATLFALLS